jgi:hypothetical protein
MPPTIACIFIHLSCLCDQAREKNAADTATLFGDGDIDGMFNAKAVALICTKLRECAVAGNGAIHVRDVHRKAARYPRLPPHAPVGEIGDVVIPDRRLVQDRVVIDGQNRRQIVFTGVSHDDAVAQGAASRRKCGRPDIADRPVQIEIHKRSLEDPGRLTVRRF